MSSRGVSLAPIVPSAPDETALPYCVFIKSGRDLIGRMANTLGERREGYEPKWNNNLLDHELESVLSGVFTS